MDIPRIVVWNGAGTYATEIRAALETHLSPSTFELVAVDEGDEGRLSEASILVAFDLDADTLAAAPNLEWVQALNAGVDHYPQDRLVERGIALTNASGVHAEPIAEQVLGYMLAFERNIIEGIRQQREGRWDPYGGGELPDATLGIIGVGAIGSRIAELGHTLGMTVLGVKRDPSTGPDTVEELYPPSALTNMLSRIDYLVIACPLTDETRGLIDATALDTLSEDAVLINIARGEIVVEDALVAALRTRRLRGAALDVFETEPLPADSPLRELRTVVMTPHMAGSTPHYIDRAMDIFVDNYRAFREDRALSNRVL